MRYTVYGTQNIKLICDLDPQHSATVSLGIAKPNKLKVTTATVMQSIINDDYSKPPIGIIRRTRT